MKYICLGYLKPGKFEEMTEEERNAVLDECFEHNDHLRANGHLAAEVALEPAQTALTLYWENGKVVTMTGRCGDKRAARRHSDPGGAGPESRHSACVRASRVQVWAWAD